MLFNLFMVALFVISNFSFTIADLTLHHEKREPEGTLLERLDYFGPAMAGSKNNNQERVRYVGCYDSWDHNKLIYTTTHFDNVNSLEECLEECDMRSVRRYAFILLKGKYCTCLAWEDFTNTRVSDEFCHVKCQGDTDQICGGHHEFSVYCNSNAVGGRECQTFEPPPVQDLHDYHRALEVRKPEFSLVGHLEPVYPCVTCAVDLAHCIMSAIRPEYDYVPDNTPSVCAEYCGRPVSFYNNDVEEVRQPTKFALTGWDWRNGLEGPVEISICKCSDLIFDKFEEIEQDKCTRVCPDADDQCGDGQKGTFTVYCADPNGCLYETPPPSSTTTEQPRTTPTESTTESDTSKWSTSNPPTEGITDNPKPSPPSPTDGETKPVTTIPTTSTTTRRTTTPGDDDPVDPLCAPMCYGMDVHGQHWESCPRRTARKPCPNTDHSSNSAKWYCTPEGVFAGDHPDMRDCRTDWVENVKEQIGEGSEPIQPPKANELLEFIEFEMKQTSYFGHEIAEIVGYVGTIFRRLPSNVNSEEFGELAHKSLDIGDEALTNQRPWLEITERNRSQTLTNLLNIIEDTMYGTVRKAVEHGSSEESEASFGRDRFNGGVGHGRKADISEKPLSYPFSTYSEPNRIQLPTGWSSVIEGDHVYYQGISMSRESVQNLLPFSGGFDANQTSTSSFTAMNTNIIGFALTGSSVVRNGKSVDFPEDGVTITLKHEVEAWGDEPKTLRRKLHHGEKVTVALGSARCVFWDTEKLEWSQAGCRLIKSDRSSSVCSCQHLTNFAVLFDTHSYTSKQLGLEILTIILCSLSVVCLLTTIVIFRILRSTHNSRTTITTNLAGCLLVGNSLVLVVMDRHYFDMSQGVCAAAGIFIHYAFLAAFMWMGIEGYYLYKLMIHVFDSGSDHLRMYRIMGYGVPVLIVGTTGAIGFLKGEDAYGGDMFCWLQGHYIWSFLVPVALVVIINSIILFITLRTAYQVKTATAQQQERVKSYKTWARGCLSLSFLLGITWTIGFLITLDHYSGSIVFAYIFTVLNGAQGIWLFTFHCLLNEKVSAAAARRNINLPTWLSVSVSKSGGGHHPPSPSYLGSRSKANIRTVFGGVQANEARNAGADEVPKEPNESILQTKRRNYQLRENGLRNDHIAEDSGGTSTSVTSYSRTSTTDATSASSSSSPEGSQRNLIMDKRKTQI